MVNLNWAVAAKCEAQNNGKMEQFEQTIAIFLCPYDAEDFVEKCLPAENRSKFYVKRLNA